MLPTARSTALALLLAACGATSPEPLGPPPDQNEPEPIGGREVGGAPPSAQDGAWEGESGSQAHEGDACITSADCPQGLMCFGPEGCDMPWTCVTPRVCTRDSVQYCTCDGEVVEGSGSCPPRAYSHRGACP